MAGDGQIVFQVTADGKQAIADIKDLTKAIQQETGKWDDAAKKSTDNIGNSFSGMLKKISAGFSAAAIGKALLDFGKAAVQAASDLEEVQNVVDTTFGDNASKIENWAKNAGNQFGLTETQAKKFSSTMGAMLKSSGLAGDKIVDVSTDLAGLAADMASFYNLDFEEAFSKIRSGMAGMSMPLKELGIDMSVDTLNAFALSQGLEKTFNQMSQSEQTMLRYQYLMQATADAQGDFARTSDGYANGVRQLSTNLDQLKTNIGTYILPEVNKLVKAINSLFEDKGEKTVLDTFAGIDENTEKKLAEISKTAEDARLLTEELDKIARSGADKAGSKIQQMAEGLNSIDLNQGKTKIVKDFIATLSSDITTLSDLTGKDAEGAKKWLEEIGQAADSLDPEDSKGWQDLINTIKQGLPGLENTDFGSKFFGALNDLQISEKAEQVKAFIQTLSENLSTVSQLKGTDAEGAKKWLEEIGAAADSLDPADAEGWATLLNTIKEGLPGIENTDFGAAFFAALGGGFEDVEKQSSVLQWAVDQLGDKTNKTAQEQALWLETCKRLVKTIPGLSSIINTETGEVKGGTQAIKEYIKAWEDGKTKLAYLKAHEEKGNALENEFSDLFGLKLNLDLAVARLNKKFKAVEGIYKKYKKRLSFDSNGNVDLTEFSNIYGGITDAERKALNDFKDEVKTSGLGEAYIEAMNAYTTRNAAYEEAKELYTEEGKLISEMPGEIQDAATAQENWLDKVGKTTEEVQAIVNSVQEATTALEDYYKGVHDSVAAAVDSAVKGFEKIETPMQAADKKTKDLTDKLTKLGSRTKDNADEWDKLNEEINKYNGEKITSQSMGKNLADQAKYMEEYLANLQKARELGVSDEVLAQLSDGSTESYDYLAALAEASPGEVETINANYQKVIDKKKELTDELTKQKLTVDQTYQSLADKAKEAVAALDLEQEAKENSGKTVSGMAAGIGEHISEVSEQVDAIIAQLERLNGYGIHIDFGGFGSIDFTTSTGKTEGSARFGLDYAPHDDYIARLHEGERVLTAQENQIWNSLLNGGVSGFDLDSLGGVMRDNIKPGGNVYLDGKIVGSVVSDRQGRSYKSLQRSGWQA